jgi:hypothetical protein
MFFFFQLAKIEEEGQRVEAIAGIAGGGVARKKIKWELSVCK